MSLDMTYFNEMEAKIPHGKVRTRFAPSPTGYMHVGNLRTALYTWLIARNAGGTFILRIEDTDQGRLIEGATDVIYRTLAECGLDHDEGPDVGGPVAPYIQSERRDTYGKYAELLVERGGAYYCFCEKTESAEDSGEFDRADDPCRDLPLEEAKARVAAGEPYVVRQRIPKEGTTTFHDAIFGDITVENKTLDDQVLIKRDGTRQAYDRQKLLNAMLRACAKRPVSYESLERAVSSIEQTLMSTYDREVTSVRIGELTMQELKKIDEVAYVRFASVYRQFADVESFFNELKKLMGDRKDAQ